MHVIQYSEGVTERAEVSGVEGVMLTFDDFLIGMDQFGRRLQPLMRCRNTLLQAA
jgi:pyrimidine oxygenase